MSQNNFSQIFAVCITNSKGFGSVIGK